MPQSAEDAALQLLDEMVYAYHDGTLAQYLEQRLPDIAAGRTLWGVYFEQAARAIRTLSVLRNYLVEPRDEE